MAALYGMMMDTPLLLITLLEYAARYHGDTEIVTRTVEGPIHRYDYRRCFARTAQLAHALGPHSGLVVETSGEREMRQRVASRRGLSRLTQISWLVLIGAILAMGVAMGSMIWQRRTQLADLKVDGFTHLELWRSLMLESVLLVGTACTLGAAFGILGEVLLSHALATVTGFPVVFSADAATAVWTFLLVTAVAVAIVAVPGYFAARMPPAVSLQE